MSDPSSWHIRQLNDLLLPLRQRAQKGSRRYISQLQLSRGGGDGGDGGDVGGVPAPATRVPMPLEHH